MRRIKKMYIDIEAIHIDIEAIHIDIEAIHIGKDEKMMNIKSCIDGAIGL